MQTGKLEKLTFFAGDFSFHRAPLPPDPAAPRASPAFSVRKQAFRPACIFFSTNRSHTRRSGPPAPAGAARMLRSGKKTRNSKLETRNWKNERTDPLSTITEPKTQQAWPELLVHSGGGDPSGQGRLAKPSSARSRLRIRCGPSRLLK
jgi:hypothetical protein